MGFSDAFNGIFGASHNTIHIANTPQAQYGRDPNGALKAKGQWMGQMGANDAAQGQAQKGMGWASAQSNGAQSRGPTAQENVGQANNEASGANGNQAGAVYLARNLATGNGPSQGAYQLQNSLNQAQDQQAAIARSGRGGASLSTAGDNAQANTAAIQQNGYTQGGILKAQDMAAGRGMYGTLLGQQRDQDNARIGQGNQLSQYNTNANDQYGLGMGNAALGFGGVGNQQDQQDFQNYQQGMNPINAQTEADQQYQAWLANNQKTAVNNNIQESK